MTDRYDVVTLVIEISTMTDRYDVVIELTTMTAPP